MIERIVSCGLSVGRSLTARIAIPRNRPPRIVATHIKVMAALRDSGLRNAGIPLEIASTPLSATAPDEKARINRKIDAPVSTACGPVKCASAEWFVGRRPRSPVATRISP